MNETRPFRPGFVGTPDPEAEQRRAAIQAAGAFLVRLTDGSAGVVVPSAERGRKALLRALNAHPIAGFAPPPVPPSNSPAEALAAFTAAVLSLACANDPDARAVLPSLDRIAGRPHFP